MRQAVISLIARAVICEIRPSRHFFTVFWFYIENDKICPGWTVFWVPFLRVLNLFGAKLLLNEFCSVDDEISFSLTAIQDQLQEF